MGAVSDALIGNPKIYVSNSYWPYIIESIGFFLIILLIFLCVLRLIFDYLKMSKKIKIISLIILSPFLIELALYSLVLPISTNIPISLHDLFLRLFPGILVIDYILILFLLFVFFLNKIPKKLFFIEKKFNFKNIFILILSITILRLIYLGIIQRLLF